MTCGFLRNVSTSNARPDALPAPYAPPPPPPSIGPSRGGRVLGRPSLIENSTGRRRVVVSGRSFDGCCARSASVAAHCRASYYAAAAAAAAATAAAADEAVSEARVYTSSQLNV